MAIRVPWRQAAVEPEAVVELALARERLHMRWSNQPVAESLATQEPGRFDDYNGRPLWGWDLRLPERGPSRYRLLVVVFGRADRRAQDTPLRAHDAEAWRSSRTTRDPLPILRGRWVRAFEVPREDRIATVRLVADYDVDLDAMEIRRHVSSGSPPRWTAKAI
jgi:hypothetical protein